MAQGDLLHHTRSSKRTKNQTEAPTTHDSSDLFHVDSVPSNVKFSQSNAMLCLLEDNDAVINIMIKGRSPTMRHVSRTHRVSFLLLIGCLKERTWTPKIQMIAETVHIATRTEVSKVHRRVRAPRWHCEGRFRLACCIHRTWFIWVSNDSSNKQWMSLQNDQDAQDTQATQYLLLPRKKWTQVAEIMVKYWRPCGSSRTQFVRTSTCWIAVRQTIWGSSTGTWMGKVPNWECLFVHRK